MDSLNRILDQLESLNCVTGWQSQETAGIEIKPVPATGIVQMFKSQTSPLLLVTSGIAYLIDHISTHDSKHRCCVSEFRPPFCDEQLRRNPFIAEHVIQKFRIPFGRYFNISDRARDCCCVPRKTSFSQR